MTELEQIIKMHEKLIFKIATRFHNVSKEDLYQAGIIGLIKAYNNYKNDNNTKFTTYAYNYIFGEMYELSSNTRTIKLNKDILRTYKKIEQTKIILTQKYQKEPSITELSIFLNIPETTIYDIYNATNTIMSLDTEETRPIYETIPSNNKQSNIDIKDSINTLTEEEQNIIKLRYYQDLTQSETANILGLSQVKVSRYEKKSLKKMYNYLVS
ncbi:MAG: sigma-70 family RNA polymerase sigma factor [Candidatus Coprovivens sp.]